MTADSSQMPRANWATVCRSESETEKLGAKLAAALQSGDIVALIGDLGAGKTRLVQAICEALGIDRREVTSPTFVLIQEYSGRLPIFHFDTYRLPDLDAFNELGAEEMLTGEGVCLIEWADRVLEALPVDFLRVEITATDVTERRIAFTANGTRSAEILQAVREGNAADADGDSTA